VKALCTSVELTDHCEHYQEDRANIASAYSSQLFPSLLVEHLITDDTSC